MHAWEKYINVENHSTKIIKVWIRGLIKLKKKDKKIKVNDIRMYFI